MLHKRKYSAWEPPFPKRAEIGTTLLETLAVLAISGIMLSIAIPALIGSYKKQQLTSTAASIRGMVRHVRIKALKEKTDHRLVFHDAHAITPNRVDIERDQGGGFVVLSSLAYRLPQGVTILATESLGVNRRGHCESGSIYLGGSAGATQVVSIKTSCFARVE